MKQENGFWDYALMLYSQRDVSDICLQLQESYQCSVNRLLFALWLASDKRRLPADLDTEDADNWQQQLLNPLRQLRYLLRQQAGGADNVEACYQQLKQTELLAERVEIDYLYSYADECPRVETEEGLAYQNLSQVVGNQVDTDEQLAGLLQLLAQKHTFGGSN